MMQKLSAKTCVLVVLLGLGLAVQTSSGLKMGRIQLSKILEKMEKYEKKGGYRNKAATVSTDAVSTDAVSTDAMSSTADASSLSSSSSSSCDTAAVAYCEDAANGCPSYLYCANLNATALAADSTCQSTGATDCNTNCLEKCRADCLSRWQASSTCLNETTPCANTADSAEEVCEGHHFTETECNAKGCCHWDTGTAACNSNVGTGCCNVNATGAAPTGAPSGNASGTYFATCANTADSGENVCEGHGFGETECE